MNLLLCLDLKLYSHKGKGLRRVVSNKNGLSQSSRDGDILSFSPKYGHNSHNAAASSVKLELCFCRDNCKHTPSNRNTAQIWMTSKLMVDLASCQEV